MAPTYALISVSDKTGILDVVKHLFEAKYNVMATTSTFEHISKGMNTNGRLVKVEDITHFPEILGGRVKTLHPKVFGGILSRRTTEDTEQTNELGIPNIDIVIVNLYPFESSPNVETIDIGGVALLRAAAKNFENVRAICDTADYKNILNLTVSNKYLAAKAFQHTSQYDNAIFEWMCDSKVNLKYGLNPYQTPASLASSCFHNPLEIINGSPGYINFLDALSGWQLVKESEEALNKPVVASFKHVSPAGVSASTEPLSEAEKVAFVCQEAISEIATAYIRARNCDPVSSYGDFIACSQTVDVSMANLLKKDFSDGIIAPDFEEDAISILKSKKNGNFVILKIDKSYEPTTQSDFRRIFGFTLNQPRNTITFSKKDFSDDTILGNITLKYTQSNSVAIVHEKQVIGIGAGQQNRIDCVKIAVRKASIWFKRQNEWTLGVTLSQLESKTYSRTNLINLISGIAENNTFPIEASTTLCSDAFFPFRDSIDYLKDFKWITTVVHPGGSKADSTVEKACEEAGITLITTGRRLFTH